MERLYRALIWLAGIALVLGLVVAIIQVMTIGQGLGPIGYGSDGITGSPAQWLASFGVPTLIDASATLGSGAMVLGLALAWADRRRGWFAITLVVAILGVLWPGAIQLLDIFQPPPNPLPTLGSPPAGPTLVDMLSTPSIYVVPLVAVLLVLVMALTRQRSALSGDLTSAPATQ